MIFEYDAEKQLALERRDGIEEGTRLVIEGALRKGSMPEAIAMVNDIPLEKVLEIQGYMLEEAK